jgi:hypothetical protein
LATSEFAARELTDLDGAYSPQAARSATDAIMGKLVVFVSIGSSPPCTKVSIVGSSGRGFEGIMRARLFWPIVIGFALTACAIQRAQIGARINMIGLAKEQVLACMGPPTTQYAQGTTEVWSYNSKNNATPAGDGNGRYCTVNVKMWAGRVGAVDYLGPAGGLITFNEACAFAVQKCVANP